MSEELIPQMPVFGDAIKKFQKFLVTHHVSSELLWVFREDVTSRKRRVFVKEPLPSENARLAESLYERGCQRGLGVQLDALCLLGSRPCCYILLPEDELDAQYMMVKGLKLSVPTDWLHARSIKSNLVWGIYVWLDELSGWNKGQERLPRKQLPPLHKR